MRFLLAIHDVWPGNFQLVAGYLARLRSLGARRFALLAVPAYHGAPAMDGNREFIDWMREESQRGTELFLHGWHHLMDPGLSRSAWGRFVNRRLVEREAEFCGLPRAERTRIFGEGLEVWRRTDLPLAGFVAPTWHGSPPREDMLAAGIPLWETRFRLHHLASGRSASVPPLAWGQNPGTGKVTLMGGEAWLSVLRRIPLIKVALHPGDLEAGSGAEGVLAGLFPAGENVGYADVFGTRP